MKYPKYKLLDIRNDKRRGNTSGKALYSNSGI